MKKLIILLAILCPLVTGLAIASFTILDKTFVHITAIYPELSGLDSVYIDARGFPSAMWAKNDPAISGYGEPIEAILWSGVIENWVIFSALLYALEIPVLFALILVAISKKRKIRSQQSGPAYPPQSVGSADP